MISLFGHSVTVSTLGTSDASLVPGSCGMSYFGLKLWLVTATGLDMDGLHVHAGIIVQLVAALILRRSLRSPLPWLVVLAVALANEAYDLHYDPWPEAQHTRQIAESAKDVWNTLAMPTLLLLLARFAPRLLTGGREDAQDRQDVDRLRLKRDQGLDY